MKNITALVSCFARYYHTKNEKEKIYNDTYALKILSEEEYEKISKYMKGGINFFDKNYTGNDPLKYIVNTYLAPSVLARSKLCEEFLTKEKYEQYLILASGYDTSGYKVNKNIKVYELDKKEIIEDKKRRITEAKINTKNVEYLCVDFEKDWINALLQSSFNKGKKTLCSLLGISYYLDKETFSEILRLISSVIPKNSLIIFDYPNELTKNNFQLILAQGAKEPMKSIYLKEDIKNIAKEITSSIYKDLNYKNIKDYFKKYNETNSIKIIPPKDVNYCILIKN